MNYKILWLLALIIFLFSCDNRSTTADRDIWYGKEREVRYQIDNNDFVIENGDKRFNRALYGSNTGFRVEAGDLPEFGLYMPRLGGTVRLGLINGDKSKWIIDADYIKSSYRAGSMIYVVKDELLGKGELNIHLLALSDADGMILKVNAKNIDDNSSLIWAYGGANNRRFSREGDLGADPESVFYLKAENCTDNLYFIDNSSFKLYYSKGSDRADNSNYILSKEENENSELTSKKRIYGVAHDQSGMRVYDAASQDSPLELFNSEETKTPLIAGEFKFDNGSDDFLLLVDPSTHKETSYNELQSIFDKSEKYRSDLANRIVINTPDKLINAVGSVISHAADGVWDGEAFQHGAVAWRMPLNGWRGAYSADWLGWHDRARTHFDGYARAQYTSPSYGESVPDPEANLAREQRKVGNAIYTDGYIGRRPNTISPPHHYDMNMGFIDQLLWHFQWDNDVDYINKMWPVIKRHLAWEKRNFDGDGDGLYNAYACFWASDAVQYSGGGSALASAYNYRANKIAAKLAEIVGEDPTPYSEEADKILNAMQTKLWLKDKGWFAEFKDLLGNKLLHTTPAVWSQYHTIDSDVSNKFQSYQMTKYVDNYIPHIPIEAKGLESNKYYTIATSNWMPYTWSVNNVALAEVLHTSLSFWKSGRYDDAYDLAKGTFLDFMVLGSSPGNFGQLSFYDAFRGELYRDFADPIGVASRVVVEGLFGIIPNGLDNELIIQPGLPSDWNYASITTPDIFFDYKKDGNQDKYVVEPNILKNSALIFKLNARGSKIKDISVNGKSVNWTLNDNWIGAPQIVVDCGIDSKYEIQVIWDKNINYNQDIEYKKAYNTLVKQQFDYDIDEVYDPQNVFVNIDLEGGNLNANINESCELGHRTVFVKLSNEVMAWWQPVSIEVVEPVEVVELPQSNNSLTFFVKNNSDETENYNLYVNGVKEKTISIKPNSLSKTVVVENNLNTGRNLVEVALDNYSYKTYVTNWNIDNASSSNYEIVNLENKLNDKVTNIFTPQYLSPRSPYPTQALPIHGYGDWCSFDVHPLIDDAGIRAIADKNETIKFLDIPFKTVGNNSDNNISFTSQWDNYPESVEIELEGTAEHVYLLMAGSSHHMQFGMVSGLVTVNYKDGSNEKLELKNPETWYPIEQDYYRDDYAFKVDGVMPPRVYLKTGELTLDTYDVLIVNGTNFIDGGAASILDIPLNNKKELDNISISTVANDVVIGVMSITLKR